MRDENGNACKETGKRDKEREKIILEVNDMGQGCFFSRARGSFSQYSTAGKETLEREREREKKAKRPFLLFRAIFSLVLDN